MGTQIWRTGVATLLWFIWSSSVQACSCVSGPEPDKALERADAVFLGTVVDFEVRGKPEVVELDRDQQGRFYRSGRRATFRIWTIWKGPHQQELIVSTGEGGGDCGFDFIVGREYLVYAGKTSEGYTTNICSRTRDVWGSSDRREADEDFRVLGKGTAIAP